LKRQRDINRKNKNMKKILFAMLLFVGLTALAQPGDKEKRANHMQDLTPEQMATLQTKKMTLQLDLTSEQQDKIMAINLENAKMRKAKMAERKAMKKDEDAKKPTSEERYARANEALDRKIAQKAEMKRILSDQQFEKWEKMQHRRGKKAKGIKKSQGKEKMKKKN